MALSLPGALSCALATPVLASNASAIAPLRKRLVITNLDISSNDQIFTATRDAAIAAPTRWKSECNHRSERSILSGLPHVT
jgi:hypothetical protein